MILLWVIPKVVLPPEPLLKIFPKIGYALFAV